MVPLLPPSLSFLTANDYFLLFPVFAEVHFLTIIRTTRASVASIVALIGRNVCGLSVQVSASRHF